MRCVEQITHSMMWGITTTKEHLSDKFLSSAKLLTCHFLQMAPKAVCYLRQDGFLSFPKSPNQSPPRSTGVLQKPVYHDHPQPFHVGGAFQSDPVQGCVGKAEFFAHMLPLLGHAFQCSHDLLHTEGGLC